jgi:hypothetical protein
VIRDIAAQSGGWLRVIASALAFLFVMVVAYVGTVMVFGGLQ